MKKIVMSILQTLLFVSFSIITFSQDDTGYGQEAYVKTNIAFSKFKLLGVSSRQYAKCLESINYHEPGKKLKFMVIEQIDFADDGRNYDLVAHDGILTSSIAFSYSAGSDIIPQGTYQNTLSHDSFVFDESFSHQAQINAAATSARGCRFKWVSCSQMTNPSQQFLCNWAGWPYGSLVLTGCFTGFEW